MRRIEETIPMSSGVPENDCNGIGSLSTEMQQFGVELMQRADILEKEGKMFEVIKVRTKLDELANLMTPINCALEYGEERVGIEHIEEARRRFALLMKDPEFVGNHQPHLEKGLRALRDTEAA